MQIKTKADMYDAYFRGPFGNRLRSWDTVQAYLASGYHGPVTMRTSRGGGGPCAYGVEWIDVDRVAHEWSHIGISLKEIRINESAPDKLLIIQGEVMRTIDHLHLRYSTLKLPMRKALATTQHHVGGLRAQMLLKGAMDPASYDDLNELLDDYDGAIIEFSTWAVDVGDCPRRNSVVWEVRHY